MKKILTLSMVQTDTQVLLGMKKRGFGEGLWNGFGGKVEAGETIEEAALRELTEEVGIVSLRHEKMGLLEFSFASDPKILEVHIFKVTDFLGEPIETEEMYPQWFSYEHIPFDLMWPSDTAWFPYFWEGKCFAGAVHFDAPASLEHTATILNSDIYETVTV